jgi:hypothetical protein
MEDLIHKLFPGVSTEDTDELIKLTQGVENGSVKFVHGDAPSSTRTSEIADALSPTPRTAVPDHYPSGHFKSPFPPTKDNPNPPYTGSIYERMLQNHLGTLS